MMDFRGVMAIFFESTLFLVHPVDTIIIIKHKQTINYK